MSYLSAIQRAGSRLTDRRPLFSLAEFAWFFFRTMEVSGAEAVIAAASPFVGQGESACLVKVSSRRRISSRRVVRVLTLLSRAQPYVDLMTPSELHLAMTSGFSTISGSVLIG